MHKRNPKAMHTVKRTLKHIKLPSQLRIDDIPNYVLEQINKHSWEYSPYGCEWGHNAEYYRTRDKALMSLGFLACGRINEVLRVERSQFDFESEPGFIVLTNFYVSKRKKKTIEREGETFVNIPMPTNRDALLYPFTELITKYLAILEGEKLFPIGEVRAWQIIKHCTGLWSHWFRALGFTYFANKIKNPFALAKIYGVKNVNTIMRYFKTEWTAYRDIYTLAGRAGRI